jgi:hypothetical protein
VHSPKALKNEEGMERKCNFEEIPRKKKDNLLKNTFEHHVVAIKEHFRVFLLGLACKKKCIVRVGEGAKACLTHKHVWRILLQRLMRKILPYLG